ncbi:hypothetical protein [Staphylococcus shinii]|uniref:hypothetical protein n=1 Tax=Staphylococcus shinii TaxID=2912228 RepID=UPI003F57AC8F
MAFTKTQKPLKISARKSEYFVDWFIEADWKLICEKLDIKKTKTYKLKNIFAENRFNEIKDFDSIAMTFTLKELNILLELYNDYIENPEASKKPKKKSEKDLQNQEEVVNKHISKMGVESLKYERSEEQDKEQESNKYENIEDTKQVDEKEKSKPVNSEDTNQNKEQISNESEPEKEAHTEQSDEKENTESNDNQEELLYKNGVAYRFKERSIIYNMNKTELMNLHSKEMVEERDKLDELERGTQAYREQELRIKYIQNRNHAEYFKIADFKKGK